MDEKERNGFKRVEEMLKSGAAKGEEVTDTLLRRLIKSNWTFGICVIAILFLLWHVVN